jgi:anti-sigma regulatory factor (Ser/Thr protein kinase)
LLCDQGPAIDPAKLRGRRLDEIKPGGLGLHFIRQSMDTVEYQRAGRINQFRLVKYLQPATQSSRTP